MSIRIEMLLIFVTVIGVGLSRSAAAVRTNDFLKNNISDLHFKLFTSIQEQNKMLKSAVFETECSSRGCTFSGCQSRKSNSCDGKMLSTLRQIEISVKQLTGKDRRKGTCKNGWKRFRGHCYREFVQKLDWFGAQMFCRLQKATLVRIDNKEENEWLVKTFSKEQLWLDLNDLSVEGRWRFFTTGKPVIYTNWMPRQPDSVGEDCAHMNYPGYKKGQWNDRECGVKLRFICESSDNLWNE